MPDEEVVVEDTKPDAILTQEPVAPSPDRAIEKGASAADQTPPRVNLDVGHEIAPGYEIVHSDGTRLPIGPARPIADGGAGVVFRAAYRDLPHRAVKVLAPREDLLARVGWEKFEESFTREIRTLARVTHTRVAKILDYGRATLKAADREHLFYAMDFIDGLPFDDALDQYDPAPGEVLDLLAQILDGLGHLHSQEIMHCDLKEKNVLLRRGINGIEATIVDLGCAKTLKAPVEAVSDGGDDDTTTFFSTPKLMMPPWQDRIGQQLTREQLLEMFPLHDLHCFGRLVGIALDGREERMAAHLGSSGLAALASLQEALVDRPGDVGDALDVERQWRKLPPGWLAPMSVRELAVGGGQTSLPTPNGRVGLSSRVKRVLNHELVQRLRHIPQLELLSTVFPGATHTRLLHSLTTFDTARLYLAHLLNDPAFRLSVEPADIEAALLWSLLHDVGHYPLSHMFEDFADEEVRRGHDRTIATDDDLFWCFLDPSSTAGAFAEYPAIIERAAAATGASLGDGLFAFAAEEGRFDAEVLAAMRRIESKEQPVHSVLAGALSSPIDVDKVAYLQDDSLMSGVRFGMGIDLAGLLMSLRMPAVAEIEAGEAVMAINDKGLAAAEGVVLARYWMLRRVYWDQENRALMAMVKFVIRRLVDTGAITMASYYESNAMRTQDDALRWLSEQFGRAAGTDRLGTAVAGGPARPERNPLLGIMGGHRVIYHRVLTIAKDAQDDEARIYDRLAFRDTAVIDETLERLHAVVDEYVGRTVMRGDVLLDVPAKERERLGVKVWVYSGRRPDEPSQLAASPVVGSLRDEFDKHVKKCRVFLHPEIVAELGPRLDDARAALLGTLREACDV